MILSSITYWLLRRCLRVDGAAQRLTKLLDSVAYVYLYRTFIELDHSTLLSNLHRIVPFMTEHTSTLSMKSTNEAVLYVFTRAGITQDKASCYSLLQDTIRLITPQPVVPADDAQSNLVSHHNVKLLSALEHMRGLLRSKEKTKINKEVVGIRHKITFYMALTVSQATVVSLPEMRRICNKLSQSALYYKPEEEDLSSNLQLQLDKTTPPKQLSMKSSDAPQAKIREIG